MARVEVHKFGGTSVGDASRIVETAQRLVEAADSAAIVAVSSAMAGVTDQLIRATDAAQQGDSTGAGDAAQALRERHHEALRAIAGDDEPEVEAFIDRICQELEELLHAVAWLRELTPRTRDIVLSLGEKLAVRLVAAAVRAHGTDARAVDADTFLDTDDRFGEASPLAGVAERTIVTTLRPFLDDGTIPVVTGFCGRAPDGATTTLGRGGSDFTATLLAGALGADEAVIWTDVDGVYSADPRFVPEARLLDQLNYREAAELSYYGAKVLHQRTMIPVSTVGVPVRIRNSFDPSAPGTIVDGRFTLGSHPVKAISAVRNHALVEVQGKGMAGVPGVAARMFSSLARERISVTMISQSSAESSICIAIPEDDAVRTEIALKREFRTDLSHGDIEDIVVHRHVCLIAAVGLGMAHTPGVAARVFNALSARRVNVLAIAQGSSELNISCAVDRAQVEEAVRAIHTEFGLGRVDTGEDSAARGFDLMLLGCGKIGRALTELVLDRHAHVFERFGLQARIVAISDRSGYVLSPTGFDKDRLLTIIDQKSGGTPLADLDDGVAADSPSAMVEAATEYRLARPVLVDVSDFDGSGDVFVRAFERGCDVVTANKKPLAGDFDAFRRLTETSEANGRVLKGEATVGAGLPVLDTLEMLMATGDRVTSAEGCLSGTLAFLTTRLDEGVRFSDAVREAVELGYTEPDPVADLSGADVARKATILGRLSGLAGPNTPLKLEGLVDASLSGLPLDELLSRLAQMDDAMAERVAAAAADGKAFRFVARVAPNVLEVGPALVPSDSALGNLSGTDNMIVFRSERYAERPLVVTGPGAGIDVTAMGVLGDVLRIAAERR